ncbi:MAG TPA: hypothetical protein PKK69_08795, partial [Ferruginibacter sp.]|nr:hypothetical protein [Ferruginibacter sp.]
ACWKNFNQQGEKRVTQLQYNEQGGVQSKQLGNQLETQEYATNIRGWITAINGSFVSDLNAPLPGSGGHYFGEIISYDSGYSQNMYNGNISGQRWKAAGDRVARSYGYLYDNANRLTYADFNQQNNGSSNWTKDEVDYSLSNLRYDANGNILSLSQRALKLGNSAIVDSLQYQYFANSNRLRKVSDAVDDDTPGHFRDTTATIDDYAYDVNGNIIKDQNRKMHTDAGNAGAVFNLLDKADSITIAGKSTTRYQYDVAGNLLQKTVRLQNGAAQPQELTYTYIAGFVYLNDTLQYSLMEEGCIRRVMRLNQASQQWQEQFDYEYFLKDHQGNVRSIITDGIDTAYYQATMETARQDVENALFANIYTPVQTQTNKPAGFDQDTENEKVCKLNAAPGTNHKTGPALLLKVMVGDRVQINTYAFYNQAAQQPGNGVNLLSDIMSVLPGALIGGSGGKLDAGSGSVINGPINPHLSPF